MSSKGSKITKARRLTLSYKGPNIELISDQKIEKVHPPSNLLDTKNIKSGFWYELTDDNHNTLYQKSISNPIQTDVEVFSNEPEGSIMRQN